MLKGLWAPFSTLRLSEQSRFSPFGCSSLCTSVRAFELRFAQRTFLGRKSPFFCAQPPRQARTLARPLLMESRADADASKSQSKSDGQPVRLRCKEPAVRPTGGVPAGASLSGESDMANRAVARHAVLIQRQKEEETAHTASGSKDPAATAPSKPKFSARPAQHGGDLRPH
jgi:hypothetical protein